MDNAKSSFWARADGSRGKFHHTMLPTEAGDDVQLCSEDVITDSLEVKENPPQDDCCKRCLQLLAADAEKEAPPTTDDGEEVGPKRPKGPDSVKKNDQVLCAYMVGGPALVETTAYVTKVHAKLKGEKKPRLDLNIDAAGLNHPACVREGVPYKNSPSLRPPQHATSWRTHACK